MQSTVELILKVDHFPNTSIQGRGIHSTKLSPIGGDMSTFSLLGLDFFPPHPIKRSIQLSPHSQPDVWEPQSQILNLRQYLSLPKQMQSGIRVSLSLLKSIREQKDSHKLYRRIVLGSHGSCRHKDFETPTERLFCKQQSCLNRRTNWFLRWDHWEQSRGWGQLLWNKTT